jgi:DNA polymerase-3 subunit beta
MASLHINKKKLFPIVSSLQGITSKKSVLEYTQNIVFDIQRNEVTLKATDMEIFFQASFLLDWIPNDFTEESFSISGKKLFESIRELDNEIILNVEEQKIILKTECTETVLVRYQKEKDFPETPQKIENFMQINKDIIIGALEKTTSFAVHNSSHVIFNSVLIEIEEDSFFSATATDGHCLAHTKWIFNKSNDTKSIFHKFLISKRAALELKKILDDSTDNTIFIGTSNQYLVFSGTNFNFFCKTVADKFPDYSQMLTCNGYNKIILDKHDLERTVKRAISFIAGKFIPFSIQINKNATEVLIILTNRDIGNIKDKIKINHSKTSYIDSFAADSILLYPPYVLNAISSLKTNEVEIYFEHGKKPLVIKDIQEEKHTFFVIMPIIQQGN